MLQMEISETVIIVAQTKKNYMNKLFFNKTQCKNPLILIMR